MERGRIAKPKEAGEEGTPSEYYLAGDLWVGGHVEFNSHRFVLIDCDEYALRYMEAHQATVLPTLVPILFFPCVNPYKLCFLFQFPHADKDVVLGKVSIPAQGHLPALQSAFREQDPTSSGHISLQEFMYNDPTLHHMYCCTLTWLSSTVWW